MLSTITKPYKRLVAFFNEGHARSIKAKKNIIFAFFMKGGSVAINFLLVPLTISYINPTQYGIWLTLSSIILWFSFFDIGFGNGLRNRFAESLAKGEMEQAKIYVSTTYAAVAMIISAVLVLFLIVNPFLNWTIILNTDAKMAQELSTLALIVFSFFCIQFVLQLINTIVTANQQPSRESLFNFLSNAISLTIIYILTRTTDGNLVYLGFALGLSPVLVFGIATLWLYRGEYKAFRPSFSHIRFESIKDLMSLGIKFFLLQISFLIVYQSSNMIITQIFGPEQVTPYNIAYKYFNLIPMVLGIIMMPFWSAFTEAWVKEDMTWIKGTVKKLLFMWGGLAGVAVIMLIFANTFYYFWVGDEVSVPFALSLVMTAYVIVHSLNSIYSAFLNGVGKVNMQLYFSIVETTLNIPMAIYLGKTLGIHGVILSTVILSAINTIWMPIQVFRVINKTAKGIWNT